MDRKSRRTASFGGWSYEVTNTKLARETKGNAYPEPIEHCDIFRWRQHCDERRLADDHMSLVAGISKSQIGELEKRGVATTAAACGTHHRRCNGEQNAQNEVVTLTELKIGCLRVKNSRYFDLDNTKDRAGSLKEGAVPRYHCIESVA